MYSLTACQRYGKRRYMSVPPNENQPQAQTSDKEFNFRRQEQMYKSQIEAERQERARIEAELQEYKSRTQAKHSDDDDDDDDSEPYVDQKKLKKTLNQFGEQTKQTTTSIVQQEVQRALQEERKSSWLKNNPDFYDVMNHAQRFAETDPELAETILQMPEGFERQKLVYKNIKALGLHKPAEKAPSIQDTIDKNRKSPYYQPSGVGSSPYASQGDYSKSGQKNAYEKMQELKARLRI
jgi:hypothetical protein